MPQYCSMIALVLSVAMAYGGPERDHELSSLATSSIFGGQDCSRPFSTDVCTDCELDPHLFWVACDIDAEEWDCEPYIEAEPHDKKGCLPFGNPCQGHLYHWQPGPCDEGVTLFITGCGRYYQSATEYDAGTGTCE